MIAHTQKSAKNLNKYCFFFSSTSINLLLLFLSVLLLLFINVIHSPHSDFIQFGGGRKRRCGCKNGQEEVKRCCSTSRYHHSFRLTHSLEPQITRFLVLLCFRFLKIFKIYVQQAVSKKQIMNKLFIPGELKYQTTRGYRVW